MAKKTLRDVKVQIIVAMLNDDPELKKALRVYLD